MSELIATRMMEDSQCVMYGRRGEFFFVRKQDNRMLALPVTQETWSLRSEIVKRRSSFIADALADFVTDAKWQTPRSLGLKPMQGEDLYAR
jgi:hypothetical protein